MINISLIKDLIDKLIDIKMDVNVRNEDKYSDNKFEGNNNINGNFNTQNNNHGIINNFTINEDNNKSFIKNKGYNKLSLKIKLIDQDKIVDLYKKENIYAFEYLDKIIKIIDKNNENILDKYNACHDNFLTFYKEDNDYILSGRRDSMTQINENIFKNEIEKIELIEDDEF